MACSQDMFTNRTQIVGYKIIEWFRNIFNTLCQVCYDYKCERHIRSVQRKEENNKTAFAVFALQILNQFL